MRFCFFFKQNVFPPHITDDAAIVHVSGALPKTAHNLRRYIEHRLLWTAGEDAIASPAEAQMVNKESVFIPSGWDSRGKIRVLDQNFDPKAFADPSSPEYKRAKEDFSARMLEFRRSVEKACFSRGKKNR